MSRNRDSAADIYGASRVRALRFFVGGLAFFLTGSLLRAEKLVAVHAAADASYVRHRAEANLPEVETYVLLKGRYSMGVDPGLKNTAFRTIASTLAADLLSQRYSPAGRVETADLVIVVNWGMTKDNDKGAAALQYDPDALRQAAEGVVEARAREEADVSGASRALGASAAAEANFKSEVQLANSLYGTNNLTESSNAELLGFKSALGRDDDLGETLRSMLNEERYFIILIAYDAPALKTGTKRRVWVTRMSIRAAGVNFPIALDRMSSVGANFYGTRQRDVVLEESIARPTTMKVDKIIVLGDTPPASEQKR